jgi:hypothetical protein
MATWRNLAAPTETAVASLPTDPVLATQDLVVVNAPDFLYFVAPVLPVRNVGGLPVPRHVRALASGLSPLAVTRRDERSLEVGLERGLFVGAFAHLYRDAPLLPGHTVALGDVTIAVLESAADGAPTRIRYRFDRPLEADTLRWVRWQEGVYVPFTPPPVGVTVRLRSAPGPFERIGGWSPDGPPARR